jgi:hypothetical protein
MYAPSTTVGPVELEDLIHEIDAENVDLHDPDAASGPSQ